MPPKVVTRHTPAVSETTLTNGEKNESYSKESESLHLDLAKEIDVEAQTPTQRKPKLFASTRYAILTLYRRLFTLVFSANVAMFVYVMSTEQKLLALVNATAANLLACGLARQPLVVNAIFVVVCSMPRSAPLPLRRIAAKVYHYGGVHSGCGVASLVWYMGFVGVLSHQYWSPSDASEMGISTAPVALAYVILLLLLAIIVVAHPAFRMKRHDYFELTHRFSGWLLVALFVALLLVFSRGASKAQGISLGTFLVELPAFWFLIFTVAAIIQPWLFLRKVAVRAEPLSTHATRLHFDHAITTFGKGIQLAKHPLHDWHSFATFPDPTPAGVHGNPSFSCLVSKAGDWTAATIQNSPTHLWKRGVLIYGFAYAMRVFKRVVVVTTGSGIGPCLSFLGDDNRPALRVLWQTRAPRRTYGDGVMHLVHKMDSAPIILDTDKCGRMDMVPIILQQIKDFKAEAVCVISNPVLTTRIVYELEARGTPAFGPIFDS
ncbi:hypothetical protein N7491_009303 [Penicillium cf. griseofulvum]|uniref:Integral membrane protein TmpA n=1 Tax=Penicillium cf. griseofulvum TaxID=2972120 RepID=A0A9W9MEV2_9EURO|nr:hypothetical protein N7472_005104 [Penicillium cf. griseofulvum]KAJ5424087.1 hypothetical protein N7491_009303 [Penicillium cf. griseofulvum]KAJ5442673.1 hypothetical protein N7445_005680 [Penicillium cf. griseofulvum]